VFYKSQNFSKRKGGSMRLKGKTAMITGASRNIGKQTALTFAREGADLVLNTISNKKELEEVAAQCREKGVKTHTVLGDVSDAEKVMHMVKEGIDALGKIDILVSNVAIRPHKPILEVSNDEWHQALGVNLHAAFYLIKAVLPGMIERRIGSIIALGGVSAITGRPNTSIVTTSKNGLLGLIRAVAAEMAPYNIRANMVNPAYVDTERRYPEWYPERKAEPQGSKEHLKKMPMGRLSTVNDIANACLYFASDESGFVTGVHLNVMGGLYIT
jgi:3-oxoacyl-[acyl-carrier protein] reductase